MSLELNPDIYRAVLDSVPMGVYLVDRQRRIVFWNMAAERITGYLGQEVIGRFCPDNLLMHCDQNSNILCGGGCPVAQTIEDGHSREADVFLRHKQGQRIPVWVRAVPVRDEFGEILGSAEFFDQRACPAEEIGDRRRGPGDPRSGIQELADGTAISGVLHTAFDQFTVTREPFGVLCAAIDGLGHLRQADGCQAAKALIDAVGQTVAGVIRPSDKVGLWADGRFLALIRCGNPVGLMSCAERLKNLVKLVSVPWWGDRLSATMSMGGSLVREDDTVESLIERASQNLAAALAKGPDSVLVV